MIGALRMLAQCYTLEELQERGYGMYVSLVVCFAYQMQDQIEVDVIANIVTRSRSGQKFKAGATRPSYTARTLST